MLKFDLGKLGKKLYAQFQMVGSSIRIKSYYYTCYSSLSAKLIMFKNKFQKINARYNQLEEEYQKLLQDAPMPFLAQVKYNGIPEARESFIVVVEISAHAVGVINEFEQYEIRDKSIFLKTWTGVTMVIGSEGAIMQQGHTVNQVIHVEI